MNDRTSIGRLVITSLSIFLSLSLMTSYTYANTKPYCGDILTSNRGTTSQKMIALLGEDITQSNRITTVIPAKNNPFVTEELVAVANSVSPNGRFPKQTPADIDKMRNNIKNAWLEIDRLQSTFELAFINLVDGHCQFPNRRATQDAKIDFDHLEGLSFYSIPALLALVDQSYALAMKRSDQALEEKAKNEKKQKSSEHQAGAATAASYQSENVLVKVEDFDGSNITFSVTNIGAEGSLEPKFNTFSAYRNTSGNLAYNPTSLLTLSDAEGHKVPTMGVALLSSSGGDRLAIMPGETRKFVTSVASKVSPHAQLSLEFPANALDTEQAFALSFSDAIAVATTN
ncbi:hypothetical protein [Vibrio mytili]|uniref:Uncharacterized protein n=1 Tax=Vibrio mytili TaxID=50718 RepID=A0A0C3I6A2_9VIBR|nr:hypothetical protein [Vibrio mytili]KIN10545.1 hypothetical protein SU60_13085 [Vibrio mytili]